jgi:hypothetical protein
MVSLQLCVEVISTKKSQADCMCTEFGKEKSESLVGLSDKQIEETVTGLVKTGV